jgi:hypothetical protein
MRPFRRLLAGVRFDGYAGVNYSLVQNGLASGFLFKNDWTPMTGIRFNF